MAGFDAPYVPGWDCHGLPIELNVERELGRRGEGPLAGRSSAAPAANSPTKFVDSQREDFKRLGVLGDWDHPYLTMAPAYPGGDRAGARQVRRARPRLQGQEARPLVPARPHGARRSRGRVRAAHVAVDLRRVSAVADRRTARWRRACRRSRAARSRCSSGRRRRGRFRRTWRSRSIPTSTTAPTSTKAGSSSSPKRWPRRSRRSRGAVSGPGSRRSRARRSSACSSGIRSTSATRSACSRDYVTLDQGTGAVHTAPGHGADDFRTGVKYGLDIYAPIGHDGRFLPDVGVVGGLKVFEANPVVESRARRSAAACGTARRSSTRIRTAGAAISRSSSWRRRSGSSAWTALRERGDRGSQRRRAGSRSGAASA